MHANQLHQLHPIDAALWLSVAGVALYTAVELRRRGAEWIERKRRERYLSDQYRLRKVAMIRARLEEAAELAGRNKDREDWSRARRAVLGIGQMTDEMREYIEARQYAGMRNMTEAERANYFGRAYCGAEPLPVRPACVYRLSEDLQREELSRIKAATDVAEGRIAWVDWP